MSVDKEKKKYIVRLNKIEGQVRGVNKLIARGAEFDDALIQISAVKSALNSVSKVLLEDHIREVFDREDEGLKELIGRVEKALK